MKWLKRNRRQGGKEEDERVESLSGERLRRCGE